MKEIRPLLEVILIFVISLSTLSIYSYVDAPIEFSVKVKQSEIKAFLSAPSEEPFLAASLERHLEAVLDSLMKRIDSSAVLDTSSHKILLTGDSMCEGLMFRFKEYAKANNHELKTVIWYSSTTVWWSESDSLSKLVRKYNPDYIFFTTGSNELFIRNIEEREKYIQDIISQAEDRKFIWIGPPNWADDTGINDLIIRNVGRDRFFESRYLTFERGPDGAHPTWSSSAVWADTISTWIMEKSRYKILMHKPDEDKKDANI